MCKNRIRGSKQKTGKFPQRSSHTGPPGNSSARNTPYIKYGHNCYRKLRTPITVFIKALQIKMKQCVSFNSTANPCNSMIYLLIFKFGNRFSSSPWRLHTNQVWTHSYMHMWILKQTWVDKKVNLLKLSVNNPGEQTFTIIRHWNSKSATCELLDLHN